ncbi:MULTISPECIES: PadR family transcriptional regulator [Arthrobacter]|uniref:Transcriptional regulator n=1 Tax=Arthrobacter psychrochitiniphilus TaxID=291045 RepID=A0A2V3DT89_9MICC|nr:MULTISPECIES: helix-turn-helix transcriptional regulator [Arthrobacter]NYG18733.1 DNA-binding PadR family transcriptional regulator [Arthrobacter psychrochitiniphilus]PXA66483.1 transcriptional regulator [Arthrobacter psychrochitiniphilus]
MAELKHLTPLAMAALGLLAERPMHPYEMYQLLIDRHEERLLKIRPGTLYHAVGRLADAHMVEALGTARDGKRPERTTYALLPAGRRRLSEVLCEDLAQPAEEYPRFPQALSEAHNLPAHLVIDLLEQRLPVLDEKLAMLGADRELAKSRGVDPAYWIDIRYQEHMVRAELDWVHGFIARLKQADLSWPGTG